VIENTSDLWLKQWLLYSLKLQLSNQSLWNEQLRQLSLVQPPQTLIIGISGAQGSGKSSLAKVLQQLWAAQDVLSDVVSMDDYYLEPAERFNRAQLWHPLFAERGVPGTHDTALLLSQLQAFRRGEAQCWRRYDKGLDCLAQPSEKTKARLLLLEGWCVGLQPQADQALLSNSNVLEQQQDPDAIWRRKVNQQLGADYQRIWQASDRLIWLNAPDWKAVCRWRAWQELPLQQQGLGKSPAELEHFMLYFERLTCESWRQLPDRADFMLTLDQDHKLLSLTPDE